MSYMCPVCGFGAMTKPPADYNICPCCGTEFGYDDLRHPWEELREAWLSKGAPWFSRQTPAPEGWNPVKQLLEAGCAEQGDRAATSNEVLTYPPGP